VDIECVGVTLLSDTLQSIGLTESVATRVQGWFRKKPMDLCVSENEEHQTANMEEKHRMKVGREEVLGTRTGVALVK
jgi:hypothetical protein